jgi:trk system potassium uptake protein
MNYKAILFFLGIYSIFVTFFSILNILYSIYFNFIIDINAYIITLIISLFLGSLFLFIGKENSKNISLSEQIFFIILSFLYVPLLFSIPYYLSIHNIGFINSYFESMSGITTTGFSIIPNIKSINEPLLLWRSSSQWFGGLMFLISIIGTLGSKQIKVKPVYLVSRVSSGINFYNNFNYNFIRILSIYFFSTIFVIFLFTLANIRLFDSFNLAFTTISSGGFLPTESLSNIIGNNLQNFVLSLALLLPIFNFFLFFKIFTQQTSIINHKEDLHLFIIIILISLIFYFLVIPNEKFLVVFISIVSSISTSGISVYTSELDISLFFILLTLVGGSVVSVSSGFKYVRFYILLKISYQEIYRLVKPISIFNKSLFNTEVRIDDNDSKVAFLIFILFIVSIFILSSILTLDSLSFEDSFKLSILTLTNTATSSLFGLENLTFFDLNTFTKMSLIISMILGKIEVVTILFLIIKFVFKE